MKEVHHGQPVLKQVLKSPYSYSYSHITTKFKEIHL